MAIAHLTAFNAFVSRYTSADENLDAMLQHVDRGRPGVVLGDFNSTPWSTIGSRAADAGLVDCFAEAGSGFGFTFPVPFRWRRVPSPPCVRIDYVWVTRSWTAVSAEVLPDGGSDHFPVRASLAAPAGLR